MQHLLLAALFSEEIKLDVVRDLLEEDYRILQLFVSPADVGQTGIARRRTYIFCAHRRTCAYLYDIFDAYKRVTKVLKKYIKTQPCDYFIATPQQIAVDAFRFASSRKRTFYPEPCLEPQDSMASPRKNDPPQLRFNKVYKGTMGLVLPGVP